MMRRLFHILRTATAIGICSIFGSTAAAFALVLNSKRHTSPLSGSLSLSSSSSSSPTPPLAFSRTALAMSDATQKNDNPKGVSSRSSRSNSDALVASWDHWRATYLKPPPPPEDTFVMMGDLLSLCVYGITDHFFCQVVAQGMVRDTLADPLHHLSRAAASQISHGDAALLIQAPVWLDLQSPYTNHVLEVNLSNQLVNHYSPLLEPMGAATCLLVACWLLAGWFHQAFSLRNTLDCNTERALMVTVQTWLTTCALLFGLVLTSQQLCGCNVSSFFMVQKGDLDYVIDSASVLILWRFLASYLLGSGRE